VKRQTDKGFPEYDAGDTFTFGGEELVPLNAGQDWHCENEHSCQRLRPIDSDNDGTPDAWEVTERNGTRHTLGRFRGQNDRWSAVERPEKASETAFVCSSEPGVGPGPGNGHGESLEKIR
jgi:hypothetical protein